MPRLRAHNIALSLDGFATGANRTFDAPFGHAGGRLMEWFLPTRTFRGMTGHDAESPDGTETSDDTEDVDDAFAARTRVGIGAEIMGRGKFGPQTGPWPDDGWEGWWGDEPPFHTPVIVLTHYPRPDLVLGETTFLFRDASPRAALDLALDLADGQDVRLGGGPTSIREFLAADLVDELHLVEVPLVLGRGVRLWDGLEGIESRFDIASTASPSGVVHRVFSRRARSASTDGEDAA